MQPILQRWLGNSAANLLGGLSAAAFTLALPALLSRHLTNDEFGMWGLAVQMVAYVNLFGLGLQTATARFVARAHAQGDEAVLRTTGRAALAIGRAATVAALFGVVVLCIAYPLLFPAIGPEQAIRFRWALAGIGAGTALQLLSLAPIGLFQGVHRNILFVSVQIGVRLTALLALWVGIAAGAGLVTLALLLGAVSALQAPLMWGLATRALRWARGLGREALDRRLWREILNYCATMTVWSLSMLLVNTVGTVVVGRIDFQMTATYSVATVVTTVLAGLINAILAPLITTGAALHSSAEGRQQLPGLLIRSTWVSAFALQALFLSIVLLYPQGIALWVGPQFVEPIGPALMILAGAHAIRNVAIPYSMLLLSTGLHRRALMTALAEGFSNLLATIVLARYFGVVGVALGTLTGALVGLGGAFLVNARRTPELSPQPGRLLWQGLLRPLLLGSPVLLGAIWYRS